MKYGKSQGEKGPKVVAKPERIKDRIERLESETGIGKPSWAGSGQGWGKKNK